MKYAIILLLMVLLVSAQTRETTTSKVEYGMNATYTMEEITLPLTPVYTVVNVNRNTCERESVDNKTLVVCKSRTFQQRTITSYKQEYAEGEVLQLQIKNKTYDYTRRGCYVCDGYLLCLDKTDGYNKQRADQFKCEIRSGETGEVVQI